MNSLAAKGLSTVYVSGDLTDKEVKSRVFNGMYQLVLISPELLMTNLYWREMMRTEVYQRQLVAFVVDEAHCIIKWYVMTHTHTHTYTHTHTHTHTYTHT